MPGVSSECAPTIQHLPDAVKTWDSGLECPPGEIWFALTQADSFGVTLFKYSDKADPKKAGRVIMMIGAAVKNVDSRKKCPMLYMYRPGLLTIRVEIMIRGVITEIYDKSYS